MKVLWIFNHPAPYKVRLFNEINKDPDIDLDVIFERTQAKDRPKAFYNINEYNFHVEFLKHGYFGNENSFSSGIKKYLKKNHGNYDLIIMNGYSKIAEMRAIKYLKKHKIDYCLYINGGIVHQESKFKRKLKTKYVSSAKWYLSPCPEADEYLLYYGAKKENIYHYPYSTLYESDIISKSLNEHDKMIIREKYQLPSGMLFVNASQFIERKNNMQLIKIFEKRDEKLLLIGDGPELKQYQDYIKENDIKNVFLLPFKKKGELFEILKACDCFITLSKEDIYGHTINEALSNGLPVISSDKVIGSKHLIENGINGYLVSLDDEEQIIKALNSITPIMIRNAIEKSKEYTIENSAKVHLKLFKELTKCE